MKTETIEKKPLPSYVKYIQNGELEPINYDWLHILQVCQQAIEEEKKYVVLPVMIAQGSSKKHRIKLVSNDKNSPRGLILRDGNDILTELRDTNFPYEIARFDATELAMFSGNKITDLLGV